MVKIKNLVTEREVLAVLNQRPPSSYAYAGFVEAYWKGAIPDAPPHTAAQFCDALREWAERQGQIGGSAFASNYLASAPYFKPPPATPDHGWSLPDTISTKEGQAMGAALTSAHLRALVDAWLETGRLANGSEQSDRRNLLKTIQGLQAVSDFIAEWPPSMSPSIDRSGFVLVLAAPDWSRPWAADFFAAQEIRSKRLFVGIMASDWHPHLCKCRYASCGQYFVGSKLRHGYRHGTFCSREHRARASANAITKARRSKARRDLIDAAARWLAKRDCGATWQSNQDLKRRLAEFLCKQARQNPNLRAGREPVRVNWVTRNGDAIQRSRRRLSDSV